MKFKLLVFAVAMIMAISAGAQTAAVEENQDNENENETRITIYPVLWQAPIYGAEVNLPSIPGGGGGGGDETDAVSRSTDFGLEQAFLAGVSIEQRKWFVDFEGEYAGLSAERESPILNVETDVFFFSVMGGWKFYDDFAVTGGVKRLSIDIHIELADRLEANTKPGIWDPMIGIDWRRFVTDKLQLNASFEGGGFGVGTDVDISGSFDADWEVLPHFVLNAGYGFLYFKEKIKDVRIGRFERELEIEQTLHGPRIGIGFTF